MCELETAKDNEGNKGEVTNITKMTIYCHVYKCMCKVCDSSICVFNKMGDVGSWYGRVVGRSWMIVAGS